MGNHFFRITVINVITVVVNMVTAVVNAVAAALERGELPFLNTVVNAVNAMLIW